MNGLPTLDKNKSMNDSWNERLRTLNKNAKHERILGINGFLP
jgi:hypothetical protein